MAQPFNYDLKTAGVTVEGGLIKFKDSGTTELDGVTFEKDYKASVVETKHGMLAASDTTGKTYDFTALTGGSFSFVDSENVSIKSFNGSDVASAIKVTVSHGADDADNNALKSVITGSGKDVVTVKKATDVSIDLNAGNDSIAITDAATATVALGDGKDTINIVDTDGTAVKITDYSYADDTVILGGADGTKLDMDYTNSMFTVTGTKASVSIATSMNNGVYELNLSKDGNATTSTHFVRTDVSSVDYVAKDAINFESTKETTTLNLTLADKTENAVKFSATEGTVNIVAGKAATNTVTVGAGVDLGLGITKKSGETYLTTTGSTADGVLDSNDTLYLLDNGKISDVKFDNTAKLLTYGDASVKGGYDATNGGSFNYNTNGTNGVLMYAASSVNGAVTYTQGVSYYANAATVDASEYGDVVLNLNGVCDDAFAGTIKEITGVTSGLVAGRNDKATTIKIATEAGKKTEVYGGAGSKGGDSIDLTNADSDSTNVIWYSNGDGMDTVTGFVDHGNNSIYFHDSAAAASVLNDITKVVGNDLTMTMSKQNVLTLNNVKTAETNVVDFKDKAGNTFKLAVGDGNNVTYASDINVYKGATTLKVDGSDDLVIYTGAKNDQFGYYDGITTIDAKEATGTVYLSGTNTNGMEIQGGEGVNNMWGGGNKVQTLTGGEGVNVFWFGNGDGRDTAKNAKAEDGVYLYNVEKIDDVTVKTSTNYFTVTVGSDSLKVDLDTAKADEVLKTFTFADKAGVQYTYDTKTNKFQQK